MNVQIKDGKVIVVNDARFSFPKISQMMKSAGAISVKKQLNEMIGVFSEEDKAKIRTVENKINSMFAESDFDTSTMNRKGKIELSIIKF